MDAYLSDFLNVIRNCSVDNSYKMAWARALVEISCEKNRKQKIELSEIALKMFKYYWNQTIFFDLRQGSNISKPPEFISEVKRYIEKYYSLKDNRYPIHFEKVNIELNIDSKKLVRILKDNVSWRFLNLNGKKVNLYKYDRGNNSLIIENTEILKAYSDILFESINFRWTQILENFNSTPRIAKKVRILDIKEIKRNNLSKFRGFLDLENPNRICFICKKIIKNETPSIDHVIPWSYLYSDDLWNLVYTHQSCNSKKSNAIPSEKEIERLEFRNKKLENVLSKNSLTKSKKHTKELSIAIEKDYVRKFWISSKT